MRKIIYPRYTREQDLRCKLTDKDIKEIQVMNKLGVSRKEIAKIFKVSLGTICLWCLPEEKRKDIYKRNYLRIDKERYRERKKKLQIKSLYRKLEIMPEFREYLYSFNKHLRRGR